MTARREHWQALLALDADTLTELAGAGLLRRGLKELEAGQVLPGEEDGQFEVDGQRVQLDPRGWAHARCSCPAPHWCKHRIAAILALQQQAEQAQPVAIAPVEVDSAEPDPVMANAIPTGSSAAPASDDSAAESALLAELAELDPLHCLRLAGSAARQRLPRLLAQIDGVRWVVRPGSLRIELDGLEQVVSYLRHGGWAGMHCEGSASSQAALKLAALWAFWRQNGRPLPDSQARPGDGAVASTEPAEAATALLLQTVQTELHRWLRAGLSQLAPTDLERMARLAIDARADALPALAGRLRQLVDSGRRLRARDDQIDEGALLRELAGCQAWCSTMLGADVDGRRQLAGGPRRFVEQEVALDLLVAGAHWWTRPGGARGLSVLLWDERARRLRRCSQARGDGADLSFTRAAIWSAPLWTGLASPERLLDSGQLRLQRARLSAAGDIAPGSAVGELGQRPVVRATSPGLTDWGELGQQLSSELDLFETRTPYLLLAPSKILPLQLDELHQTFCWPLVDSQGTVLTLRWPCGDEHQRHSRILTHWSELPGRKCLLVACQETPRAMLQPVSLLQADGQHWRVRALQYSDEPKGLSL
ncbi:MAG: SWIM zinc finger family protein, partial [Xanthomonadales bacterium]|nr:SWIM zinc finger family protein [Xanthomonadales bacterium]